MRPFGAHIVDASARGLIRRWSQKMVLVPESRWQVSATIGDIVSMDPRDMTAAVERMATTGVDYIKIGFFAGKRALE